MNKKIFGFIFASVFVLASFCLLANNVFAAGISITQGSLDLNKQDGKYSLVVNVKTSGIIFDSQYDSFKLVTSRGNKDIVTDINFIKDKNVYDVTVNGLEQNAPYSVSAYYYPADHVNKSDYWSNILNIITPSTSPTIANFSPTSGKVGDNITINGTNFTEVKNVYIAGVDVGNKFTVDSTTQITATVPSGFIGGKITVKTATGEASSSQFYTLNKSTPKLTVSNIKETSADITVTGLDSSVSTYRVDVRDLNIKTGIDLDKAIIFKKTLVVNSAGTETINLNTLSPNGSYIAELSVEDNSVMINGAFKVLSYYDFNTPLLTTVKNLVLDYSDVTATSVKLNVSGSLLKGDYLFYVYDENTYPNGEPAVPFKAYTNSSDSQGLSLTISGLTSSHDYVGVLDKSNKNSAGWGTQNAPEPVHFTTLSDSTAMNNIIPSNTPTPTPTPAVTSTPNSGVVPDCGKVVTTMGADGKEVITMNNPCGFKDLVQLINNIIKFLLFSIATPLIALILMYTGYLYLTAGGSSGQTEKVRHILFNAVIGYVVALAAWLIVKTILSSLNIDPTIETFLK